MGSDSTTPVGDRSRRPWPGTNWSSHFSRANRAPTVVINPADDAEFEAFVKSVVPDVSTPESLEEALRQQYPQVVVHRRELSSEPITIWYVYRDVRWQR